MSVIVPPTNPSAPSAYPKLKTATKEELSLKHFSDDVITSHIYTKHRDDDTTKIDVGHYISFVENMIANADKISEAVTRDIDGRVIHSEDSLKTSIAIDPPADILQKIANELSFKDPGIEKAHETTLDVLDILTRYPWEAKAIMTLAAFATDYGVIWHLNHYSHLDPLAKTLSMTHQTALLKKQLDSLKYRQVVIGPRSLIQSCLQIIKYMDDIRDFSKYDVKEIQELSSILRQIPLFTYWVIHAIVASTTEISSYLARTEGESQKYLNELAEKIAAILNLLENYLNIIRGQQEEIELYKWLVDHTDNFPTEITLVVSKLLYGKIDAKPLINTATLKQEMIEDALREKNVILVISGVDISDDDIHALHQVNNELKKEENFRIVWIPIINSEVFEEENRKRYEYLRSTMKWYTTQYIPKVAGLRFLEEKWQFRDDPLIVVLDSKSKVQFTNAIHLIRVWGTDAIPFTHERAKYLLRKNWPESTIVKFSDQPRLQNWINQERSIIFYGGKDPNWIQRFEEKVVDIKNDRLIRDKGISFETVFIGKNVKGTEENEMLTSRFWITQWGFFIIKSQLIGSSASETTEDILRLISYENENGWAILAVGSAPLLVGRGSLILAVLDEFNKWKQNLNVKGFPDSFKDHFNDLASKTHQCERVTLPGFSGWIPMVVNCPECPLFMDTGISFKCCHGRGAPMN